ncbi:glutamate receptor 2-like [Mya arenaria]|uniref:glutamate receptor 2-like n=1 Tax=Mya arenaria TaxID=6604 RepID=UPI0022E8D1C8|nr:glutamate receptor 2-like [Mya arenaria]
MTIIMRLIIGTIFLLVRSFGTEIEPPRDSKCPQAKQRYDFVIGLLSPKAGVSPLQGTFDDYSKTTYDIVTKCYNTPYSVNLDVDKLLNIPENGWTHIKDGIDEAMSNQANAKRDVGLSVVVGPFYQNLAMVLEELKIPYIVTDYMGFDWSDISRVDSTVQWKNIIEVRPPMPEFNSAIVDFFVFKGWESAVMIMPENPKDNQECQNLARQMVENNISPISYTLRMRDGAAEVLRNVQLLEQKKIVICSPRDDKYNLIQMVLDEASLFQMLADESYSFFILDPTTHLKALTEINMYRNGLFAAKCDLFAYRYKDTQKDYKGFATGYGFGAADAAKIITDAKYYYLGRHESQKYEKLSKELFLKVLKEVVIADGATGYIRFNENGTRVNYTLSLYNHGGVKLYNKIATWSKNVAVYEPGGNSTVNRTISTKPSTLQLIKSTETQVKETRGIFKDIERVVVVLEEPFVMYREAPKGVEYQGNDRFEGFTVDLLNQISEDLKFKYEIVLSPGNEYGGPRKDTENEWGGIVGEVLTKNATMGMGAISITSQRKSVIDFSLGVISTGVNILITKPVEKFNMFQFLTPFSLELWMAIIGSSFGICIVYFILDLRSKERVFTIKSTLWFSLGTLLMKGSETCPRRTSQRILTIGYLFFVMITVSTYTANMAAFLTKRNLEEPINSFEELAERDEVVIYTVDNSATMNFLKSSAENTIFRRIWEKIDNGGRGVGLVPNASLGRIKVTESKVPAAFIFDSMINSYVEKKYCRTQSVSAPILLQEHGIAMYNGAPFKSQLNIELLRLKEKGFIQELKKKWWENTRECDFDFDSRNSKQVSFDLEHTAGVFIVGCFGLGSALALFILKKAYVFAKTDSIFQPVIRREDTSTGSSHSSRTPEEKPVFGHAEGKQSTV